MLCPYCKKSIPDDGIICPYCGTQVAMSVSQSPYGSAGQPVSSVVSKRKRQSGKNNMLNGVLIGLSVLVVIGLGVIGYFTLADNVADDETQIEIPESDSSLSDMNDEKQYDWLSERAVGAADLAGKTAGDLRLLRNAIFARHGYIFKSADLTEYFSKFSWYQPKHKDVTAFLSKLEQQNIAFISKFENGGGSVAKRSSAPRVSNAGRVYDYSDYVLYTRLTSADIAGLSKSDLRIMRNTIFARHGYIFKSADLANYFSNFDWYEPRYKSIPLNAFSDTERHNIQLIQSYE